MQPGNNCPSGRGAKAPLVERRLALRPMKMCIMFEEKTVAMLALGPPVPSPQRQRCLGLRMVGMARARSSHMVLAGSVFLVEGSTAEEVIGLARPFQVPQRHPAPCSDRNTLLV